MAEKILNLESKVKEMDSKTTKSIIIKEAPNKDIKVKRANLKGSVFKFGDEARSNVSDEKKSKEEEKSAKYFKCDQCDYKSEKIASLKKHNDTKHIEQKCKVCNEEFKTSKELITHVANKHATQEEAWSVKFQSTPKSDKEKEREADELLDNMLLKDLEDNEEYKKGSSFVFRESMLDEFLD